MTFFQKTLLKLRGSGFGLGGGVGNALEFNDFHLWGNPSFFTPGNFYEQHTTAALDHLAPNVKLKI